MYATLLGVRWLTNWPGDPLGTGRGHSVYMHNYNEVCARCWRISSVLTTGYRNALAEITYIVDIEMHIYSMTLTMRIFFLNVWYF